MLIIPTSTYLTAGGMRDNASLLTGLPGRGKHEEFELLLGTLADDRS